MLTDYITCALWSSADMDTEEPMDTTHGADDLAPEALATMREDLDDFVALVDREGIAWRGVMSPGQFAHDFWLTRNGHGAGFWDRGLGDLGDRLSDLARSYGGCDLYIGDDGLIYAS